MNQDEILGKNKSSKNEIEGNWTIFYVISLGSVIQLFLDWNEKVHVLKNLILKMQDDQRI